MRRKYLRVHFLIFILFLQFIIHSDSESEQIELEKGITIDTTIEQRYKDRFLSIPGIVSIFSISCDKKKYIWVEVINKTQETLAKLPKQIDGYAVVIFEQRDFDKANEVKDKHSDKLFSLIPGMNLLTVQYCCDKICIKIGVVKKTKEVLKKAPKKLEGYPVRVKEISELIPLNSK